MSHPIQWYFREICLSFGWSSSNWTCYNGHVEWHA